MATPSVTTEVITAVNRHLLRYPSDRSLQRRRQLRPWLLAILGVMLAFAASECLQSIVLHLFEGTMPAAAAWPLRLAVLWLTCAQRNGYVPLKESVWKDAALSLAFMTAEARHVRDRVAANGRQLHVVDYWMMQRVITMAQAERLRYSPAGERLAS